MHKTLALLLLAAALVVVPAASAECQDIDGIGSACAELDSDASDGGVGLVASADSEDGSLDADAEFVVEGL